MAEWIPVTERLPNIAELVLAYSDGGVIDTAWRTSFSIPTGAWDTDSGQLNLMGITHWMPLPEPPEGGADG